MVLDLQLDINSIHPLNSDICGPSCLIGTLYCSSVALSLDMALLGFTRIHNPNHRSNKPNEHNIKHIKKRSKKPTHHQIMRKRRHIAAILHLRKLSYNALQNQHQPIEENHSIHQPNFAYEPWQFTPAFLELDR